ncbi:MAG: hypothetical protein ACK5MZ_09035 [Aestuariibaculum sp.]
MKNKFYTTLPVGICIYALRNRKVNQVKLYIYLKSIASGHIKYDSTIYDYSKQWAKDLNCHPKTIKSRIDWLIKKNWITINSKSKSIRIVSYKQICAKNNIDTKRAAIFEPNHYNNFKAFCIGVAMMHFRNRKKWNDRRSVSNKTNSDTSKNRNASPKGFYPMPNLYLAKCLGVSKTTAYKFKKEAIKYGYIIRKKQKSFIYTGDNKLRKDAMEMYAFSLCLDDMEDKARRLRKGKKYLKIIESDLVKTDSIILKTKRLTYDEKFARIMRNKTAKAVSN